MRDPHVVALHYRLETGPQLAFNDPPPVERATDAFSLRLDNGQLRVEMKDHFATADAARLEVEPYLRSWEIAEALKLEPAAIRFLFERPEIEDRDPPPPDASMMCESGTYKTTSLSDSVNVCLTRNRYPDPPDKFIASPDVVAMWERYADHLTGKDRLTNAAWWCLTTIERNVGRAGAAAKYAISDNVLKTLHRLAHVGDEKTARKRFAKQELRPHTPDETAWMEAVVKRIIQRVGEWESDRNATWPQITMEDFPRL